MLLQVHDELVLEVAEGDVAAVEALVRRAMEGAAELQGAAGRRGGKGSDLG